MPRDQKPSAPDAETETETEPMASIADSGTVRRAPVTTTLATAVREALAAMRAAGVQHLVVVDGGGVAGIVEARDFIEHALAVDGTSMNASLTVADVMTRVPACAAESTTLESALALMERYGVSVLPVLRGSALVGTITESELLRAVGRHLAEAHGADDGAAAATEGGHDAAGSEAGEGGRAAARSQVFMSNPLIQNAMELLAQAGI
jgi:CBS domain-containing protein